MRSCIKDVYTQKFERLWNTRNSLNSLADKMFTNSVIGDDIYRSQSFQNICDEVTAGMEVTKCYVNSTITVASL